MGGGVVADIFRARFGGGGVLTAFFPLTAVTDPKFGLFKHVLCFARVMSTLWPEFMSTNCPNWGGQPPVPYAYVYTSCTIKCNKMQ